MDQLDTLRIYVRVAEMASFTQAAQSLGLPKASISTAVQRLELQMGTRLLHRTTRRVQMTHDGQAFYERSKDLLADVEELQGMFRLGDQALQGRLRVDLPLGVARSVVMPQLPAFLRAHPGLEIEFSSTDRRVDLVREGFDCVLRVGPLADSSLVARPLGRYRLINCASPAYLAAHGTPRTLADLARHSLIHYVPTLGTKSQGFEYHDASSGEARFVTMAGAVTVNNSDAYQAACLAGLGLIQVPAAGVRPLIEQGLLVEVLPDFRAASMPVSLLVGNRRHIPKRVQVFMAWLGEVMAPHLEA
ncbi:LysR family transcriptional regulator [Niveibacterium umoris]|uniref:DNA-binding transcriptional LysR family regulator n=1 Tax=Niveibacterium umoris TaxID=1193620 RepID=A0A840BGZ1_9RHOO|nr:LysR family transcriptional regulator [Niveibacterium umoris]MBB4010938.1 DNA-binding transcriptional LysR family regulator [Niveibacterium umoris]